MTTSLVPLSRTRHAGKRLIVSHVYPEALGQPVAPLIGAELAKAAVCMPIGFGADEVPAGAGNEIPARVTPVVIMSLQPNMNLFVAPDGRWLGEYVPTVFRRHPFALANIEGGNPDELTVVIDEASSRLTDRPEGIPLFDDSGEMTDQLRNTVDFLRQVEANAKLTAAACARLVAHDLIVPWKLSVRTPTGEAQPVTGLYRVDEARLGALPDEAFLDLRRDGALVIAQLQLVSMQRMSVLPRLVELQGQWAAIQQSQPKLGDMLDLGQSDEITFSF